MHSLFRTLSAHLVLVLVVSGVSVSAQAPSKAHQTAGPFVGTWVLNVVKSTYEGGPPKVHSIRTLDTHGEGLIVATHRRLIGTSDEGVSHWVGNLSGEEFPEFQRTRGNNTGNMVSIKPVNDHLWNVTFKDKQGKIVLTDTWTVSADGKTLTIDRRGTPPQGPPNHSVEVYENDGFARPQTTK